MTRWLLAAWIALIPSLAVAQNNWVTPGNQTAPGSVQMCLNSAGQAVPFNGAICGATVISNSASGTVGAVVATLTSAAGKTAFLCNWNVYAVGSATISPITITGLLGGTLTFNGVSASAAGTLFPQTYAPCLPASGTNTNIVITTTADATASAVNLMASGYLF
jgi:hypothetical protein